MLGTTAAAMWLAYFTSMIRSHYLDGVAFAAIALGSLAGMTIFSTATAASIAYDINPTRMNAVTGAVWGFAVYALIGILIGLVPSVR